MHVAHDRVAMLRGMRRPVLALLVTIQGLAACTADGEALGGFGVPAQLAGETYPGPRRAIASVLEGDDVGCLEAAVDGAPRFVIWPAGARLDHGVRLADGTILRPGDPFDRVGALTPIEPLAADPNGFWASLIGFCAPASREALVLDEVRRAEGIPDG